MRFLDQLIKWKTERYIRSLRNRGLKLGNGVFLNDGFFLDPSHCFLITIEDRVVFGPNVSIFAHDASSKKVVGKTKIGRVLLRQNCFIGASTIILPGSEVGANSIVGANSVVSGIIPADEVWAGNPATKIMSANEFRDKLTAATYPDFPESLYQISAITESRKEEILAALSKHRFCFLTEL